MKKIIISISASLLLLMTGCRDSSPKYRIGVSQPCDDEWRSQMNDEIRREILFHEDAKVEIRSADDNSQKQIADLEYFAREKFDLIIVAPNEAETLTPAVRKIYNQGIPVIVFDRAITDSSFTTYIDLDNERIGSEAAKYAVTAARRTGGAVAELRGLTGSTPADERQRGFASVIMQAPDVNFIGTFTADWNAAPAERITDSLLRSNPEIKVIYAQNDVMAVAAAKKASERHRDDITVIGTDGAPKLGAKAVADSVIDITFTYPTVGDLVISKAMDILHGKEREKVVHIPNVSFINRDNAAMHLRMNDMLQEKTSRIEEINSMYNIVNERQKAQKWIIYAISAAAVLFFAAILGLIYFLRQKDRFRKTLADKNALLLKEQKEREELYEKLEESTRSKLAFYTNVSHDLRTPLTLIADPVRIIFSRNYLPAEDKEMMGMVVKNVAILRRMIDQILDFRKYEAGQMKLSLREVDIFALVREWTGGFYNFANSRQIDLSLRLVDETSPASDKFMLALDVEKFERIFFNLVSNALKFTPRNGFVKIICKGNTSHLLLEVADTGIGLEDEEKERIFYRFYQADKPRPNGSGIGLSLTKAFVNLMEGRISVESEKGKGSIFRVEIPVKHTDSDTEETGQEAEAENLHENPEFRENGNGFSNIELSEIYDLSPAVGTRDRLPLLLVIDDNAEICRLVRMMMSERYQVIEAHSGKEGLQMALRYIPDVIICDIMMPDMDGLEVTRRLKEERISCHIPVLILTACRLDRQRVKSYDSGADGFISKPFSRELIESRIESLIKNRQIIYNLFLEEGMETASERFSGRVSASSDFNEINSDFYRDFIRIVKDNYSNESFSVPEIAEKLGIGATQLTRKIKALTRLTPVEIIRSYRLKEARRKLLTTDATIAEIAYSSGFASSQYFSKCFRDEFNITPSELRASIK